jgi:hypothetical protein
MQSRMTRRHQGHDVYNATSKSFTPGLAGWKDVECCSSRRLNYIGNSKTSGRHKVTSDQGGRQPLVGFEESAPDKTRLDVDIV